MSSFFLLSVIYGSKCTIHSVIYILSLYVFEVAIGFSIDSDRYSTVLKINII